MHAKWMLAIASRWESQHHQTVLHSFEKSRSTHRAAPVRCDLADAWYTAVGSITVLQNALRRQLFRTLLAPCKRSLRHQPHYLNLRVWSRISSKHVKTWTSFMVSLERPQWRRITNDRGQRQRPKIASVERRRRIQVHEKDVTVADDLAALPIGQRATGESRGREPSPPQRRQR
jgi:hypothetical protein